MTTRRRQDDRTSAGRSELVPFVADESAPARHARRLEANLGAREELRAFCAQHGIGVAIHNGGHHWVLTRGTARAEWWPSSAKLVFDQQWSRGVHTHDHVQVQRQLAQRWRLQTSQTT